MPSISSSLLVMGIFLFSFIYSFSENLSLLAVLFDFDLGEFTLRTCFDILPMRFETSNKGCYYGFIFSMFIFWLKVGNFRTVDITLQFFI